MKIIDQQVLFARRLLSEENTLETSAHCKMSIVLKGNDYFSGPIIKVFQNATGVEIELHMNCKHLL